MTSQYDHERRGFHESRHAPAAQPQPHAQTLTLESAEQMLRRREDMLVSIQHNISATLYTALCEKVAYERSTLYAMIESDAHMAERIRMDQTLTSEYFERTPLDIDFI
jgi:hypothetical protein